MSAMGAVFSVGGFSIKRYQKEISIARDRILEASQVVKTAQGLIEYSTAGKGLPVLFIHGAGGGHDMGRLFARRIGDDFFWICPSRFGYLRTPIPEDASFESQADAYAALLDYLHIEKAAIIGLSIGGPSALLFALRHPNRCAALVLLSAISKTTVKRPISDWFFNIIFSSDFFIGLYRIRLRIPSSGNLESIRQFSNPLHKMKRNGQTRCCIFFILQAKDIQE